ncbi:MAG: hypothetical protein DWQ02_21135 [Bacteroidetes bacterium]|nr:MAG: hypothetical protein DWQ02_21135 [Bacteroidota bacterium]
MKKKKNNSLVKSITGNKPKPATTVIYNTEVEKILEELKLNAPQIERRARLNGARGIPQFDLTTPSDTEMELKAKFEGYLRDCLKLISLVVTNLQEKLDSVKRINNLIGTNPHEAMKETLMQVNNPLTQELQAVNNEAAGKIQILESKKERLEQEREKDMTEKNNTEEALGFRPRKKPWWYYLLYIMILAIGTVTDIAVTYKNIEEMAKVSAAGSLFIAFSIAVAIALSARFSGKSIRTKNRKGTILSLVGALALLSVISFLAIEYGSWITALINLAMFLVLTLVSYFFAEEKDELINKYFEDETAIEKTEKQLAGINTMINGIQTVADKHKIQLIRKYQVEVINEYNIINRELAEWIAYRDNVKDRFTSMYRHQIHRYRNLNQDERKDKKIPLVKMWQENNHIPPLSISGDGNNTIGTSVPIPEPPSDNGTPSKSGITALSLLFICSLTFGSCEIFEPSGVDTVISILPDQTDNLEFDVGKTARFIFNTIELDTVSLFKSAASIEVSSLNDRYTNRKWQASLPKSGSSFTEITKERIALQRVFYNETIEALQQGSQFSGELARSRLYHSICEAIRELEQSPAERRICLLFSDGLENTKNLSFYQYRNNPQRLLKEKDMIIEKLESECTLPDLSGIDLYIIHQPSPELDELVHVARQFWKDYFESHGATVYLLAGI